MSTSTGDSRLDADVQLLTRLLYETVERHDSAEVVTLMRDVERLGLGRAHVGVAHPTTGTSPHALGAIDPARSAKLARAFTVYFHLVNVAEQVHRLDESALHDGASLADTMSAVGLLGSTPPTWPGRSSRSRCGRSSRRTRPRPPAGRC